VGVDEPSVQAAIESIGVPVLKVRHPLPACQRIHVTRPVVVVVGPMRAVDVECVAAAAAEVKARVVELAVIGEDRITTVLERVINAALVERSVLPALR
jgi:predicted transcriptional regulator